MIRVASCSVNARGRTYDRWTRIRRPLLCHELLRRNNGSERCAAWLKRFAVPLLSRIPRMYRSVPPRESKRGQTNMAISFFLLFWVAKRKVTRATGRQRELSAEYFMRARKYECLTAYTGTPLEVYNAPWWNRAFFCRECKFVSCYLHEVGRRSYDRFPQTRHERDSSISLRYFKFAAQMASRSCQQIKRKLLFV